MFRLTDNASAAARAETQEITNVLETVDSDNEDEEHGNNSGSDDHSSSDRSGSGSSTSNTGSSKSTDGSLGFWNWGGKGSNRNEYNVGQKESRYVGCLKLVVISVIVVSGVFMARVTYDFMVHEQAADFHDEVRGFLCGIWQSVKLSVLLIYIYIPFCLWLSVVKTLSLYICLYIYA